MEFADEFVRAADGGDHGLILHGVRREGGVARVDMAQYLEHDVGDFDLLRLSAFFRGEVPEAPPKFCDGREPHVQKLFARRFDERGVLFELIDRQHAVRHREELFVVRHGGLEQRFGGAVFRSYGDGGYRSARVFEFKEDDVTDYTTRLVFYDDLMEAKAGFVLADHFSPALLTKVMKVVYFFFGGLIKMFEK